MEEAGEVSEKQKSALRRDIEVLQSKLDVLEKFTQQKDILETEVSFHRLPTWLLLFGLASGHRCSGCESRCKNLKPNTRRP